MCRISCPSNGRVLSGGPWDHRLYEKSSCCCVSGAAHNRCSSSAHCLCPRELSRDSDSEKQLLRDSCRRRCCHSWGQGAEALVGLWPQATRIGAAAGHWCCRLTEAFQSWSRSPRRHCWAAGGAATPPLRQRYYSHSTRPPRLQQNSTHPYPLLEECQLLGECLLLEECHSDSVGRLRRVGGESQQWDLSSVRVYCSLTQLMVLFCLCKLCSCKFKPAFWLYLGRSFH